MKFIFTALALLLSLGLTGCSLLDLQQDKKLLEKRLNNIQNWQVRGKLSVINRGEAVTGFLTWQQNEQNFDIFLSGPFGQGSSHLIGNHQQASLTLPGEKPVQAASADELMEQLVGWKFPVLDIRYWVKGQASPNSSATEIRNSMGLLESLKQHGWNVQLSRYKRVSDNWLPGRIKIVGNEFTFILAIKQWDIKEWSPND
jgi:outer membrane lipoprotein LolB